MSPSMGLMTIRFCVSAVLFCGFLAAPLGAREGLRVSSPFGWRIDPLGAGVRMHDGIDLPVPAGAPVRAAAAGQVRFAGWRGGYGAFIEIAHVDGTRTRYGHLSRILVGAGQVVAQGEVIGAAGSTGRSTGSHLHFEYVTARGPVDPLPYLGVRAHAAPEPAPAPPWRSAFAGAREGVTAAGLPDGDAVAAASRP